jgi:hypothetical protein
MANILEEYKESGFLVRIGKEEIKMDIICE